jgi:hypothetical protein
VLNNRKHRKTLYWLAPIISLAVVAPALGSMGRSMGTPTPTGPDGGGPGLGLSPTSPLPIAQRIALPPPPSGMVPNTTVVAVSGDGGVDDGGVGLVLNGSTDSPFYLATVVNGQPVAVPNGVNALHIAGDTLPGTSSQILVYSRNQALTYVTTFANFKVYDVNPNGWSLEFRVVNGGTVVGSSTFTLSDLPTASMLPIDVDTSGAAGTAQVLVGIDTRGVPGWRLKSDNDMQMQIFDIGWDGSTLAVTPEPREQVTEAAYQQYMMPYLVPPQAGPTAACGKTVDPFGNVVDDGPCEDPATVCVGGQCVAGTACTPRPVCQSGVCGLHADGCGELVDCGGCDGGRCGAVLPGMCGNANATTNEDIRAIFGGAKVCGYFTVNTESVAVGCDATEVCTNSLCVK